MCLGSEQGSDHGALSSLATLCPSSMPTQNASFPLQTTWKGFYGTGMPQRGPDPSLAGLQHAKIHGAGIPEALPEFSCQELQVDGIHSPSFGPDSITVLSKPLSKIRGRDCPLHGHSTVTPPQQSSLPWNVLPSSSALIQQL